MKRGSKAAMGGAALMGFVILFFYVPVVHTISQYGPFSYCNEEKGPSAVGYESLGCAIFGLGDSYYTGNVSLVTQAPVEGLVFSCHGPLPVG